LENGEAMTSQLSSSHSVNEQTSAPAGVSANSKQSDSSKNPQKAHSGQGKPTSVDINVSEPVNAMPPLLSPLPAALISPDHPDIEGDTVSHSSKKNLATHPISVKSNSVDGGPAGQSQNDIISPLESPFEMPTILSPLPDWWMEKMDIDMETLRRHDFELSNSNTSTLGARRERSRQPDTPGVARKTPKSSKTKSGLANDLAASSAASTKASGSTAKLDKNQDIMDREKLIVKLKYGKRNIKPIVRLLQMQARPVTETKNAPPAHTPVDSGSRKHARARDEIEEPSIKRSKVGRNDLPISVSLEPDTKKQSRQIEIAEESSTKPFKADHKDVSAPSSSGSNSKKHPHPADDTEEHSTKRPKVSGNIDIQRARTPLTPSAQSPAPSINQKQFSTPKRGDAMKSVAMRKVDSNEGQVLTPHGGSVSTPASTEKPRAVSSDGKSSEVDALKGTHTKYMTIGTTLKRQADKILKIKEKDPGPVSEEDKRLGAVIAIEAVIAYMIGMDSMDKSRHKERKLGYAEQWAQFLPFMVFATERSKGLGVLFTLALLLNAICRESLERIYVERLAVDPAGITQTYLKDLAKNSQMRQSALSAYRDQCRDHPVDFIVSIDEAKGVAISVLADYCEKMDIAWESKLEL
jgi:hypothetical protein